MRLPRLLWTSCSLLALAALPTQALALPSFIATAATGKDPAVERGAQVALLRDGTRTVMSLQTNYEGPLEAFALVIPVPVILQKDNIKTLPREVFDRLDQVTAPRLIEAWEQDPCQPAPAVTAAPSVTEVRPAPTVTVRRGPRGARGHLPVMVEAQFAVDEYDIAILSADDSANLEAWLKKEKYLAPNGSAASLEPYIKSGSKFVVAKVDPKKVTLEKRPNGASIAKLAPLRFTYESPVFSLPSRLGVLNAKGPQDLLIYVLGRHQQRYEAANYPNVVMPTNLDVGDKAKAAFPAFYSALFDKVLEKNPTALVTEYAWKGRTCDACTTSPLSVSELGSLGAETLSGVGDQAPEPANDGGAPAVAPATTSTARAQANRGILLVLAADEIVITRLHARYTKDFGEDIVFKPVAPIAGGRELRGKEGELEVTGPAATNAFQARYTIRHPFAGATACQAPKRGIWGAPPQGAGPNPLAAQNLSFAAKDANTPLSSYLRSELKELAVAASAAPPTAPSLPPVAAASPSASASGAASAPPSKGGCGDCTTGAGNTGNGGVVGIALGTALVFARRRKARRASGDGQLK